MLVTLTSRSHLSLFGMPRWFECGPRHGSFDISCAWPNWRTTYTLASPIPHAVPERLPRLSSREREATAPSHKALPKNSTRPFTSRASVVRPVTSPRHGRLQQGTISARKARLPPQLNESPTERQKREARSAPLRTSSHACNSEHAPTASGELRAPTTPPPRV